MIKMFRTWNDTLQPSWYSLYILVFKLMITHKTNIILNKLSMVSRKKVGLTHGSLYQWFVILIVSHTSKCYTPLSLYQWFVISTVRYINGSLYQWFVISMVRYINGSLYPLFVISTLTTDILFSYTVVSIFNITTVIIKKRKVAMLTTDFERVANIN